MVKAKRTRSVSCGMNDESVQNYLSEISRFPLLSRAEETVLIRKAKRGDSDAFHSVIRSNLLFVVTIAREYSERKLPLIDIISEGNLGLFRALELFEPDRGTKFITYARWWIRQSIVYALIYKSHVVRVPQSQLRRLKNRRKLLSELEKKLNRQPTQTDVEEALPEAESSRWPVSTYPFTHKSLEAPSRRDQSQRLLDVLACRNAAPPDREVDSESLALDLSWAFRVLDPRELEIIMLLYGLESGCSLTLGEVGSRFGISRERVRQIKNGALDKMRGSEQICEILRGYLDHFN